MSITLTLMLSQIFTVVIVYFLGHFALPIFTMMVTLIFLIEKKLTIFNWDL